MNLMLCTGANILRTLGDDDSIAVGGAVVKINNLDDSLALIYEDKIGTAKVNPFVTDSSGQFHFYAAPGQYMLTATKNAVSSNMPIEVGLSGQVEIVEIETNDLQITDQDHGVFYNVADLTGSVAVTLNAVPPGGLGKIVFVRRNTDSPIQFIPAVGVTIESAYSTLIYDKFSTAAMISMSETSWALMGDLEQ